jgi:hypothetical protein
MRRLSTLLVSAGMLAVPAFAQINLTGSWGAATQVNGGPALKTIMELTQTGDRIDGREQITTGTSAILMHVSGRITAADGGYLRETAIEQNRGFRRPCLQAAQLRILGTNGINLAWQPSAQCGGNQSITLGRMPQPAVSRNRQPQISPGDAFLMMLMLGLGSSSDDSSAEQREMDDKYHEQVQAKERMDDDRQREQERKEADRQAYVW